MRFPIRIEKVRKEDFYVKCVKEGLDLAFTFSYICEPDPRRVPHSQKASETVLNLPAYSSLSDEDLYKVANIIQKVATD